MPGSHSFLRFSDNELGYRILWNMGSHIWLWWVRASRRQVLQSAMSGWKWKYFALSLIVPFLTLGRPKCARIRYSRPPPSCFIFHTKADLSGAYWTFPVDAYISNPSQAGVRSDCPFNNFQHTHPELGSIRIIRYRNEDFHIVRSTPSFELCFTFDHILHPAAPMALHCRLYPDQWLDGCGNSVGHEFELSVRRDKGDCAVVFESRQTDALVKLDIFHLDCFAAWGCGGYIFVNERWVRMRYCLLRPVLSNITLSFRPNRSSGMPDR